MHHSIDQAEGLPMTDPRYFDRLLETADLIARHVDYPGKRQVVERCREEVEDLTREGRLTVTQRDVLWEILEVGHEVMS
jgi:hypothetical protein